MEKTHTCFLFDGFWSGILGKPEKKGVWLIYGKDKNGKTWGTLLLCDYLSRFEKILYISAEQGISASFKDSLIRANINPSNRNMHWLPYQTIEELYVVLKKRQSANIVVLDNITFYLEELQNGGLVKLLRDFPNKLFIFLAHEERGAPYSAPAKLASKIAEIIIQIKGLMMIVGGRCPGGNVMIDEEKATLYHGQSLNTNIA